MKKTEFRHICIDATRGNNSRIFLMGFATEKVDEKYSYSVIQYSGGLNSGQGRWSDYFKDLQSISKKLEEKFESPWIIEVNNDVDDDVFYITFATNTLIDEMEGEFNV